VVIAEFSDFQCPYCREEAKSLRDNLLKAYPTEARLYFFDYPLEQIHPGRSLRRWRGGACLSKAPRRSGIITITCSSISPKFTAENMQAKVLEFAKGVKDLNVKDLEGCMVTKGTEAEVNSTVAMGQAMGVNQTPTVFVNGRRLGGVTSWENMKFVIDFEIGYQKTAKNAGEDCGCDVKLPEFGGARNQLLRVHYTK